VFFWSLGFRPGTRGVELSSCGEPCVLFALAIGGGGVLLGGGVERRSELDPSIPAIRLSAWRQLSGYATRARPCVCGLSCGFYTYIHTHKMILREVYISALRLATISTSYVCI
jgi:hypothetical protein